MGILDDIADIGVRLDLWSDRMGRAIECEEQIDEILIDICEATNPLGMFIRANAWRDVIISVFRYVVTGVDDGNLE
ncbi:MAG: hypothetical protein GY847_14305 [Proteobacteria bacterium]|nr:hypothetical protein [Pseudomonadota bacterium]